MLFAKFNLRLTDVSGLHCKPYQPSKASLDPLLKACLLASDPLVTATRLLYKLAAEATLTNLRPWPPKPSLPCWARASKKSENQLGPANRNSSGLAST